MENVKLNVRALCAMLGMNLKELAEASGIEYNHLRLVSCGDARMLAEDLMSLSELAKVPPSLIDYSNKK